MSYPPHYRPDASTSPGENRTIQERNNHAPISSGFRTDPILLRRRFGVHRRHPAGGQRNVYEPQRSPGRLTWRCRHAVHFGERAVACGTAADGGVAGIHPAGAHPGIHRLRRRRSAGVPTVRFRLNSITAVIRSGTPADIRKGLRPSTGRSPSHRGKSVLRHPLLQRATALRWRIPRADQ